MCESLLCVQLTNSLDAAFGVGVYEGEQILSDWGSAVLGALHNSHHNCRNPLNLIWQIAHNNMQKIIMNCPCEGLAQAILRDPERFLRSILVLSARYPSRPKGRLRVVFH